MLQEANVDGVADLWIRDQYLSAQGIPFPYDVSGQDVLDAFRARCLAAGPSWTFEPYDDRLLEINSHRHRAEFSDPSVPDQTSTGGQNGGTVDVFDSPGDALRAHDKLVATVGLTMPGHRSGFVQGNILLTLSTKMSTEVVQQYAAAFQALAPSSPSVAGVAAPATIVVTPVVATATPVPTVTPVPFNSVVVQATGEMNSELFYLPAGNFTATWTATATKKYGWFLNAHRNSLAKKSNYDIPGYSEVLASGNMNDGGDPVGGVARFCNVPAGQYFIDFGSSAVSWTVKIDALSLGHTQPIATIHWANVKHRVQASLLSGSLTWCARLPLRPKYRHKWRQLEGVRLDGDATVHMTSRSSSATCWIFISRCIRMTSDQGGRSIESPAQSFANFLATDGL